MNRTHVYNHLEDSELTARGRIKRRSEHCSEVFGLSFQALAALTALVARERHDLGPVARPELERFLQDVDGITVGNGLLELKKLALVREVGKEFGGLARYASTRTGAGKVAAFGREARIAEAAE